MSLKFLRTCDQCGESKVMEDPGMPPGWVVVGVIAYRTPDHDRTRMQAGAEVCSETCASSWVSRAIDKGRLREVIVGALTRGTVNR